MTKGEVESLQQADNWDWERTTRREGGQSQRVVVSVSLAKQDFERIAEYARSTGMKTSEFIREAALDHLPKPERTVEFALPVTAAGGLVVRRDHDDLDRTAVA